MDSFDFDIRGAAGWVLGPDDARRRYSLFSLGEAVPSSSRNPRGPGAVALAAAGGAGGFGALRSLVLERNRIGARGMHALSREICCRGAFPLCGVEGRRSSDGTEADSSRGARG